MRKILYILMLVILTQAVLGIDLCGDIVNPNQECMVVTPVINCNIYNYTIYNNDGIIIETANLTLFNESIYYATFNKGVGQYIIKLCDDSTREIFVKDENIMGWTAIILGLGIMASLLLFSSFSMKRKELDSIKLLLFPVGIIFTFIIGLIPLAITLNPSDVSSFTPVTTTIFTIVGGLMIAFIYLYGKHLLFNVFKKNG